MPTTSRPPDPSSTAAIILGASVYPHTQMFTPSETFQKSAVGFRTYLQRPIDERGFGLAMDRVFDVFNSPAQGSAQVTQIADWLSDQMSKATIADVIFYYVGHGAFHDNRYFLALAGAQKGLEVTSSLRASDLVLLLKTTVQKARLMLIIDACFSAELCREMMAAEPSAEVLRLQTTTELPDRGVSLLCSSAQTETSNRFDDSMHHTMFSGALLDVLQHGITHACEKLSLQDVYREVNMLLKEKYGDNRVRPEVRSPKQKRGDVANMPFFPNHACPTTTKRLTSAYARQLDGLIENPSDLSAGSCMLGLDGTDIEGSVPSLRLRRVRTMDVLSVHRIDQRLAENTPIVILTGPQLCGKTWLARSFVHHLTDVQETQTSDEKPVFHEVIQVVLHCSDGALH